MDSMISKMQSVLKQSTKTTVVLPVGSAATGKSTGKTTTPRVSQRDTSGLSARLPVASVCEILCKLHLAYYYLNCDCDNSDEVEYLKGFFGDVSLSVMSKRVVSYICAMSVKRVGALRKYCEENYSRSHRVFAGMISAQVRLRNALRRVKKLKQARKQKEVAVPAPVVPEVAAPIVPVTPVKQQQHGKPKPEKRKRRVCITPVYGALSPGEEVITAATIDEMTGSSVFEAKFAERDAFICKLQAEAQAITKAYEMKTQLLETIRPCTVLTGSVETYIEEALYEITHENLLETARLLRMSCVPNYPLPVFEADDKESVFTEDDSLDEKDIVQILTEQQEAIDDDVFQEFPCHTAEILEAQHNSVGFDIPDNDPWELHKQYVREHPEQNITSPVYGEPYEVPVLELNDAVQFDPVSPPRHPKDLTTDKQGFRMKAAAEPVILRDPFDEPDPDCAGTVEVGEFKFPSVDELDELTRRHAAQIFAASDQHVTNKIQRRNRKPKFSSKKFYQVKAPPNSPAYHPVSPGKEEFQGNTLIVGGMFPRKKQDQADQGQFVFFDEEHEAEAKAAEEAKYADMPLEDPDIAAFEAEMEAQMSPSPLVPLEATPTPPPPPPAVIPAPVAPPEYDPFAGLNRTEERRLRYRMNRAIRAAARFQRRQEKQREKERIRAERSWRRYRIQLADLQQTYTNLAILTQQAKQLPMMPYSGALADIFQWSIGYQRPTPLTFIGFRFLWNPMFNTFLGVAESWKHHVRNIEAFVRAVARRDILRCKFMVTLQDQFGDRWTRSTAFQRTVNSGIYDMWRHLQQAEVNYEDSQIAIFTYELHFVPGNQPIVGGKLGDPIEGMSETAKEIAENYFVISPHTKTNCLWVSVAILTGWSRNNKLIYDKKTQNEAGKKLKKAAGYDNRKAGNQTDVAILAEYKNCNFKVIDGVGNVVYSSVINEEAETHSILMSNGHFCALIPKTHEQVAGLIREDKPERKECSAISKIETDFIAKEKRMVAYDLESYRKPVKVDSNGKELEIEQVAYAIAWCFQLYEDSEKMAASNLGYEVVEYEWNGKNISMAYKEEVGWEMTYEDIIAEDDGEPRGTNCLDRALHQWLTQDFFHNAVFYAHNGGKFDVRLIMGQSSLMVHPDYKIDGDRTIELNSRIINMQICNENKTYKEKKWGKQIVVPHTIQLKDSLVLFGPGSSLAKLTAEFKVPHKKMEEKINIHELQTASTWFANWNEHNMSEYLKHDVLGLWEVLHKFNFEVKAATNIPITCVNTGASLSKKFYLSAFYNPKEEVNGSMQATEDVTIYTLTPEIDKFIRQGYGGGRCEAFVSKKINEPVYYYDFTSLYPDVGRQDMPTGKPRYLIPEGVDATQDRWKQVLQREWNTRIVDGDMGEELWFWQVKVHSPLAAAGTPMDPLKRKPLFGRQEESMYLFRWYAQPETMLIFEPEIRFAVEHGLDYAFEPLQAVCFKKNAILKPCMETLFVKKAEAKAAHNEALSKTWKIIINSLYGVWGLKTLDREGVQIAKPSESSWMLDLVNGKLLDVKEQGEYIVSRRLHDLEVSDCNVAIASAVTSYARLKLYRLFMDIQDRGGKLLYCDTDSIITTYCIEEDEEMKDKWMGPSMGEELGSLKNEICECYEKYNGKHKDSPIAPKYHFEEAVIVAPKLYVVSAEGGKLVKKAHKGYREDPSKGDVVTLERMSRLVDTSLPLYERTLQQETVQWIGGNADLLKGRIGVRNVVRHKKVKQVLRKGVPDEEGDVQPYNNEEEMKKRLKEVKHINKQFK